MQICPDAYMPIEYSHIYRHSTCCLTCLSISETLPVSSGFVMSKKYRFLSTNTTLVDSVVCRQHDFDQHCLNTKPALVPTNGGWVLTVFGTSTALMQTLLPCYILYELDSVPILLSVKSVSITTRLQCHHCSCANTVRGQLYST